LLGMQNECNGKILKIFKKKKCHTEISVYLHAMFFRSECF
jgi:hypothetical protein